MIKIINGQRTYFRHLSEDTEEVVEDSMLHEHQDGTVHSHEGGDVDHEHEENLDEQDNKNHALPNDSDSGNDNPWLSYIESQS
jgi:hypothetical protein